MTYITLVTPCWIAGQQYEAGPEVLSVSDADAKALLALGYAIKAEPKPAPLTEPTKGTKPSPPPAPVK